MKVYELFEEAEPSMYKIAKNEGYKKILGTKKIDGKFYSVVILTKLEEVNDTYLNFQYIINPETHAWSFDVSDENVAAVEFASGEDVSSFIEHMKKKKKLSKHNFEKYFSQEEEEEEV